MLARLGSAEAEGVRGGQTSIWLSVYCWITWCLLRGLKTDADVYPGTGVAYVNLSIGSETVRWVQKWPGRFQANENKVPTVVVYPTGFTAISWSGDSIMRVLINR